MLATVFVVLNAMVVAGLAQFPSDWPDWGKWIMVVIGAGTGAIAGTAQSPRQARAAKQAQVR